MTILEDQPIYDANSWWQIDRRVFFYWSFSSNSLDSKQKAEQDRNSEGAKNSKQKCWRCPAIEIGNPARSKDGRVGAHAIVLQGNFSKANSDPDHQVIMNTWLKSWSWFWANVHDHLVMNTSLIMNTMILIMNTSSPSAPSLCQLEEGGTFCCHQIFLALHG